MRLLLLLIFISAGHILGRAQSIADPCFFSVGPGLDFQSSGDIVNVNGTALLTHHEGIWYDQGDMEDDFAISINSPVTCDFSKVFFMPMAESEVPKGVAFRLNAPLQLNQNYSFTFTYVSHGAGSQATFSPKIYTGATSTYSVNGVIQATGWGTLPAAGGNWTTQTYNFFAGNAQQGHQWLFFMADQGSGMLFNSCHIETDPVLPFELEQELIVCEGGELQISAPVIADNYQWNTGVSGQNITVFNPGVYTVQASNLCNREIASTTVIESPMPKLNVAGADTTICIGQTLLLEVIAIDPDLTWSTGSTASSLLVSAPDTISVRAVNDCFDVMDTVIVFYDSIPQFSLPLDTTLCIGQSLFVDGTVVQEEVEYLWNDGLTEPFRNIDTEGDYVLTVTNLCGSSSDDITVLYSPNPGYIWPDQLEYCQFRTYVLDVSWIPGTYVWNDGSTGAQYEVTQPGIYTVEITDDDGCFTLSDQVQLAEVRCNCPVYVPNAFTPNGDGVNDVFLTYHDCEPYDYELIVFDRWGQEIHRTRNPYLGWDGYDAGTPDNQGVYCYSIRYKETHDSLHITKQGHFTLIR